MIIEDTSVKSSASKFLLVIEIMTSTLWDTQYIEQILDLELYPVHSEV